MITIFLDFDGVLHPEFCRESNHFACLKVFEQVLRECRNCDVVITSTWRLHTPIEGLRGHFAPDLSERIVGATDEFARLKDIPDSLVSFQREAECHAWLRAHDRGMYPWLAVDDRSWLYRPFNRSLFLVDGKTGLTPENARDLIERLRRL